MPGVPDIEYVVARTALLDALEALGPHRDAAILVGRPGDLSPHGRRRSCRRRVHH